MITDNPDLSLYLDIYTPSERREYLVQRGSKCHPTNMRSFNGLDNAEGKKDDEHIGVWYDVLSRYDSLLGGNNSFGNADKYDGHQNGEATELEHMAVELWKYCVLYNGDGHVYLDYEGSLLRPLNSVLTNQETNLGIISQ